MLQERPQTQKNNYLFNFYEIVGQAKWNYRDRKCLKSEVRHICVK